MQREKKFEFFFLFLFFPPSKKGRKSKSQDKTKRKKVPTTHHLTLSLCAPSSPRSASSRSGLPEPSITSCAPCDASHPADSTMRSTPFW